MAEYIDREALLQEIRTQKDAAKTNYPKQHFVVGDVLDCICRAQAADVAPVVHGEWIRYDASYWRYSHSGAYPVNRRRFKCSVCGRTVSRKEPYCHCGARMDL